MPQYIRQGGSESELVQVVNRHERYIEEIAVVSVSWFNDSIQDALNYLESTGGGICQLARKKYTISEPIQLPSKVTLVGETETAFYNAGSPSQFIDQFPTRIILENGANCHMIIPKTPAAFYAAGLKNVLLDGNKDYQTESVDIIHLTDNAASMRSQFKIETVFCYRAKGRGFYDGDYQSEIFFDQLIVFDCDGDGIVIKGQDVQGFKMMAGRNGGNGIVIQEPTAGPAFGGVFRGFSVDSFNNVGSGLVMDNVANSHIFYLQVDGNDQYGIHFKNPSCHSNFFHGGRTSSNGDEADNTYSDIYLTSTGSSPYDLFFNGVTFGGAGSAPKPKYIFETALATTKPKIFLTGCSLKSSQFGTGITNDEDLYSFTNTVDDGTLLTNPVIADHETYRFANTDVTLNTSDGTVHVSAASGDRTVTLPPLADVEEGRFFKVRKSGSSNLVTVQLNAVDSGSYINTNKPLPLKQANDYCEFMKAGSGWEASGPIPRLRGTVTHDFGSIADGAFDTSPAITVTNAEVGDLVQVLVPYAITAGVFFHGYVTAANTAYFDIHNESGAPYNPPNAFYTIFVTPNY